MKAVETLRAVQRSFASKSGVRGSQNDQIREAVKEYAEYNVFTLEYPRENEPCIHLGQHDLGSQ